MADVATDRLRSTAYHEAGHAVVAHYFGARVEAIRIMVDEFRGDARVSWPGGRTLVHRIMVARAGQACVNAFHFSTPHDDGALRDEVDILNALEG